MGAGCGLWFRHKSQVLATPIIKALNVGISEQSRPRTVIAPGQVRKPQRRGDRNLPKGAQLDPALGRGAPGMRQT